MLKENLANALNSEDIGTLQALKSLDSLETKINQVQVAYQQFYTTVGIEDVWKALLDSTKNVIDTLNSLPKVFGKIPVGALAVVADVIHFLKQAALAGFKEIAKIWQSSINEVKQDMADTANKTRDDGEKLAKNYADGIRAGIENVRNAARESVKAAEEEYQQSIAPQSQNGPKSKVDIDKNYLESFIDLRNSGAAEDASRASAYEQLRDDLMSVAQEMVNTGEMSKEMFANINRDGSNVADVILRVKNSYNDVGDAALSSAQKVGAWIKGAGNAIIHSKAVKDNLGGVAAALNTVSALFDTTTRSGQVASGSFMALAGTLRVVQGILAAVQDGMSASVWGMLAIGVVSVVNGIATAVETTEERIERLTKEAEELSNVAKQEKANYSTLQRSVDKLEELEKKRYDSTESAEEYQSAVEELADSFPQLIIGFDEAGNAIVNVENAEVLLAEAREKSAEATLKAIKAERDKTEEEYNKAVQTSAKLLQKAIGEAIAAGETTTSLVGNKPLVVNGKTLSAGDSANLNSVLDNLRLVQDDYSYDLEHLDFEKLINDYSNVFGEDGIEDISVSFLRTILEKIQFSDIYQELESLQDLNELDFQSEETRNRITQLNDRILEVRAQYPEFLNSLYEEDSKWQELLSSLGEIPTLKNTSNNLLRTEISEEIKKTNKIANNTTFLTQLATSSLISTGQTEFDSADYVRTAEAINTWWEQLFEQQEQVENIFKNINNYTFDDFYSALNLTDDMKWLMPALYDYYKTQVRDFSTIVQGQLANDDFDLGDLAQRFETESGVKVLSEVNKTIAQYKDQKLFKNAAIIRAAYSGILNVLASISDPQLFSDLTNLFSQGFSSKDEIEKLVSQITSTYGTEGIFGHLINFLNDTSDQLVSNYLLTVQSSLEANTERYKTDEKTISKLTKGLSLDEVFDFLASALGQQSGLAFEDFKQSAEGAFTLSDEQMRNFWNKYIANNYAISQELTDLYNKVSQTNFELTDEEIVSLGQAIGAEVTDINKAVDLYKAKYKLLQDQVTAMNDLMIAQLSFNLGDYTALALSQEEFAAEIARGVDVKRDDPMLQAAVETASKAISSYLNDAIEKGINNIDAKLYALPSDVPEVTNLTDLVKAYSDYYSNYSKEYNDLVVQAIQKDADTTSGAAQDALKDVTFIKEDIAYASLETIQKLADIFGKNINEIFDLSSYDAALDGYQLNLNALPELQAITNAQNMVADSIASYFERIATLISQGLSGKLDNSGRDELVSLLDKYNIDLDLKFTQTAEGLRLSVDSAASLYSELYKVDSIRASLVFDELVKQFTAAGEKCETISGTLAEIKRLENELAKEENKGNKELENRLALYQRIVAQQSQDPNQFKFMDRNLPNGMQSPENYWNAVGKAYTAINEASTTGYMSIQDYYNIITEMSNLVTMSNGELEWMGMTSENASQRAAELIKLGMSALANVDGKGVQVALSKLGGDFVNGAAAMKGGLDKGIKVMAQEQIKMLDAQIMMLEAVVAMEELGDIDVDGNGIDKWDIFTGDYRFNEQGQRLDQYTETYKNWAEKLLSLSDENGLLQLALNSIVIEGHTLQEYFDDAIDGWKNLDIQNETLIAIIKALEEAGASEDWTTENIAQLWMNFFGDSQEIDITPPNGENPIKLVASSAGWLKLEFTDDGVIYNGKTYPSETDAINDAVNDMNQKAAEAAGGEKKVETQQTVTIDLKTVINTASNTIGKIGSTISDLFSKNNNTVEQKTIQVNLDYGTFPAGLKDLIEAAQTGLERAINIITPISELPTEIEVTGRIVQYAEQAGINFNEKELSWLNKLTGYISYYTDADNVSTSGLIEKDYLWGTITRYTEADDKVALISLLWKLNTLTGNISKYTDDKADIDNLNQLLNLVGQLVGIDPGDNFDPDTLVDDLHGKVTIAEKDVTLPDISLKPSLDSSLLDQGFEEWKKNNPDFFNPIIDPIVRNNIENTPPNTSPSYNPQTTFNFGNTINSALTGIANWLNKANENASNNGTNLYSLEEFSKIMEEHAASTEESTDTTDNNRKAQENNTKKTNEASRATGSMATQLKGAAKNALQAGVDFLTSTKPLDKIGTNVTSVTNAESGLAKSLNRLGNAVESAVTAINAAIKRISTGSAGAKGTTKHLPSNSADYVYATGNFANARGTLMGELGEELYVTNGHYYIAGAAGPEFVDLPDDAIVFNHLQTKRLLQNGKVSTHGKPVTNEKKATSFATGNAEGPAMASARSVLEELKNIRAMWQALLDADPKKLGSLAGSGKGGGGGSNKDWDMKSYTAEIQRWYNLLRQIAVLEKEITHQETLRSKLASDLVPNGRAIYESQKKSLAALDKEIINQKSLLILQKEYYADQQKELENSEYNKIFEFKDGTLQYRGSGETGSGLGLDILEQLQRRDVYGKAIDNAETAQKQLDYLVAQGFDIDKLRYNDDGTEVKLTDDKGKALEGEELQNAQVQMLENFFSNVSSFMNEFDSAADNIADLENNILENESSKNEILRDIRDNQIELEEKIRDAIVEREQQRIDKAKKERDALKESADEFLEGLNNSLNKERQMYQANQSAEDLNKLRRRLAILQRSGGSSSQIHSLQQEIDSKSQDAYFDAQQKQIDAVKKASDLEIERLDKQISIMEETLDYQKVNGLFWDEVSRIMSGPSDSILHFIKNYTKDYNTLSPTALNDALTTFGTSLEQWISQRDDPNPNPDTNIGNLTPEDLAQRALNEAKESAKGIGLTFTPEQEAAFLENYMQTGDSNQAQAAAFAVKPTQVEPSNSTSEEVTPTITDIDEPQLNEKTQLQQTVKSELDSIPAKYKPSSVGYLDVSAYKNRPNTISQRLRALQLSLADLGYNIDENELFADNGEGKTKGYIGATTLNALSQFRKSLGLRNTNPIHDINTKQAFAAKGYSGGGIVDYTGLAVVHGSPTQPESFLDAEDTKFLKANLKAQKVILPDLMDAYRMVNNYNTINRSAAASTSNAMQIDNIDINLQIASMNSRYDAKQAANDIADELMSIARKSGNISINRR